MSWILFVTVGSQLILYGPYANEKACVKEAMSQHLHIKDWMCERVDGWGLVRKL